MGHGIWNVCKIRRKKSSVDRTDDPRARPTWKVCVETAGLRDYGGSFYTKTEAIEYVKKQTGKHPNNIRDPSEIEDEFLAEFFSCPCK